PRIPARRRGLSVCRHSTASLDWMSSIDEVRDARPRVMCRPEEGNMPIARSFSLCGAVVMATLVASAEHGMVDSSPTILTVETASNPTNTLMIDFDVTTSKPASVTVTYFDPLEPEFVVSKPTDLNTTHHFTIVRLKA